MPFRRLRMYFERIQQKRKALHMLALSGVVRPGHSELRYTTPLLAVENRADAVQNNSWPLTQQSSRFPRILQLLGQPTNKPMPLQLHQLSRGTPGFRKAAARSIRSSR